MRNNKSFLSVPVAILIAGIIIAVAIIYSNQKGGEMPRAADVTKEKQSADAELPIEENNSDSQVSLEPVTAADHILGSLSAPVKIVEFSDTECPFCKLFHPTLKRVIAEYGGAGQVAWVYRHFPIKELHSRASKEAEATECAAELGGPDAFWKYLDRIFEITPANNGLNPAELPNIAVLIGLDRNKFTECLNVGKYASKVEASVQAAVAAGGRGTPYSVIVSKNGEMFPINGAQSYEVVKQVIDTALGVATR